MTHNTFVNHKLVSAAALACSSRDRSPCLAGVENQPGVHWDAGLAGRQPGNILLLTSLRCQYKSNTIPIITSWMLLLSQIVEHRQFNKQVTITCSREEAW